MDVYALERVREHIPRSLLFIRDICISYYERMKTRQPKSKDMVERVARFWRLIEDGHHGLETDLRNKSGKVVIQERVGESNPTILSSFLFARETYHFMKPKG